MYVGRKGALVLLTIVVLWAAMPALVCPTPAAHRSCCEGMGMESCASMATMHCGDCCSVQPTHAPLLPGSASATDHAAGSAPSPAPIPQILPLAAGQAMLATSAVPRPPGSSGIGSILRI